MPVLLIGQTLGFAGDPMSDGPGAARHSARGGVVIEAGRIAAVGQADALRRDWPGARIVDYGSALISAGFIDSHTHYPQTAIIASWGKRLLEWLHSYTFPEEMKFSSADYASEIASRFFNLTLSNGTTTVCSYGTIHPESVDAFFTAARQKGLRAFAGKTCMDRNAPAGLRDSAQSAYDDSKRLLQAWHGVDRLSYVITPRFSPTSTPEQLRALGDLWDEYPQCLLQTHISEQSDEVAWVKDLFPDSADYLDTYESCGLAREGTLFGHAIHLSQNEISRIRDMGAALIHCPTSNTFIGSGLFPTLSMARQGIRIGLATDTGGGSSFSMLRTMAAAYEIGQLRGTPLHPAQLWWLATQGSARTLRVEDRIGNLVPGMEADLVVIDLASTPAIAQRVAMANDFWEALFPTIMMGDDRAVKAVWIAGNLHVPDEG